MNRTRTLALLALILLPLLLLGWLGLRVGYEDQTRHQQDIYNLLRARLEDHKERIQQATLRVERQLLHILDTWDGQHTTLFQWQRNLPLVRQCFWLDQEARLRYPSPLRPQTPQERDFLDRTRTLWAGTAVLQPPNSPEDPPTQSTAPHNRSANRNQKIPQTSAKHPYTSANRSQASNRVQASNPFQAPNTSIAQTSAKNPDTSAYQARPPNNNDAQTQTYPTKRPSNQGDSLQMLARTHRHGWLVWYWAEGLHLLFWKRTPQQEIVGVEVDRVVLLSNLTAQLPDNTRTQGHQTGRMMLLDGRGNIVYQWGKGIAAYKKRPLVQIPLSYPLHSWSLAYNGPEATQIQAATGRYLYGVLLQWLAVAVLLVLLGLYVFVEWSRDTREAAQRVSFVTQVSHELKTPLTNIRLYAELLENRVPKEDPRAQRHIRVIVEESQRLSRLIHNILTFSRQQRQKHSLHPTSCDPNAILQRTLEQFAPTFATKNIVIETETSDAPFVFADPDAIEQILGNLLNNVEKYAAEGEWLGIRFVKEAPEFLRIEIQDNGPGIPATFREHIFHPFFRLSGKLSDGVTGTGIGLTIARELARQMGGDLRLLPRQQGACFALLLPTDKSTHPNRCPRAATD